MPWSEGIGAAQSPADGDGDGGGNRIDVADAQLLIEGHVVVGREDVFIRELTCGQTHQLHKAGGDSVHPPSLANGGDDLDPARAFHHHRTTVQSWIVDAYGCPSRQRIGAAQGTADGDRHCGWDGVHVRNAQLIVQGHIVIAREDISVRELFERQSHQLREAGGDAIDRPSTADGGDDRCSSPADHFDRTTIDTGIVLSCALTWGKRIGSNQVSANVGIDILVDRIGFAGDEG